MRGEVLTNEEYRDMYPIGTNIRWVVPINLGTEDAKKDIGKTGKIVGYDGQNSPYIFLPESNHKASNSTQAIPITWWARWEDIDVLYSKGEQLLFDF